jgi:PleD family two-component response regulator
MTTFDRKLTMPFPARAEATSNSDLPNGIKALLLDDSTFDRRRIRRLSDKTAVTVDLVEVASVEALRHAIELEVFDLILIDYRLPQGDGLEVLAYVRKSTLNHDAATIMITGDGDIETAVAAMRNGCNDYLSKEAMTAHQLGTAMIGAVQAAAAHRDLAGAKAAQRAMICASVADALCNHEVQGAVKSMLQSQLAQVLSENTMAGPERATPEIAALIATFGDDDTFIFN